MMGGGERGDGTEYEAVVGELAQWVTPGMVAALSRMLAREVKREDALEVELLDLYELVRLLSVAGDDGYPWGEHRRVVGYHLARHERGLDGADG